MKLIDDICKSLGINTGKYGYKMVLFVGGFSVVAALMFQSLPNWLQKTIFFTGAIFGTTFALDRMGVIDLKTIINNADNVLNNPNKSQNQDVKNLIQAMPMPEKLKKVIGEQVQKLDDKKEQKGWCSIL